MNKRQSRISQNLPDAKTGWIERISYLLDEQFRFPGTNFRFGLDPIMNLVPFLGDISGFFVSAALVFAMAKNGASSKLLVKMSFNILLDATIGAIPVLGQIFDFYFKANSRNIKLLKEHYAEGKHTGSAKGLVIGILIGVFLLIALIIYALWSLATYIFAQF